MQEGISPQLDRRRNFKAKRLPESIHFPICRDAQRLDARLPCARGAEQQSKPPERRPVGKTRRTRRIGIARRRGRLASIRGRNFERRAPTLDYVFREARRLGDAGLSRL
jgi:hypothetical protein